MPERAQTAADAAVVAVLDIGKTNVKLLVFDDALRLLGERAMPNRPLPGPPYPHADVSAIWDFLLDGLTAFAPLCITDIIVTTHGAAAALIAPGAGDDGLALPILDYEFAGPEEIEPAYALLRPPFTETLSPPLGAGLNVGRQLAFQRARHREAFTRATGLVPYPQYWAWRLCGVMAAEATSLGCHTDLWMPEAGAPSSLLAKLGLSAALPPRAAAGAVLGPLSPAIAARTGLSPRIRVRCGIHDSNASLVPHLLARAAPFTVVSTGTWVVLFAIGGSCARLDPAADMLANVDALGRPVACARFMGGREFSALAGAGNGEAGAAELARLVASGTMALPAFSPVGGRFAGRAGRVLGPAPETPAEKAALAALYCALLTVEALERLDATGAPLIVEGPFADNGCYLGALATLLPQTAVFAAVEDSGTARGAALIALDAAADDRSGSRAAQRAEAPRPIQPFVLPGLADHARLWRDRIEAP